MKVFISYSSKDKDIAEQIYLALVKENYAVFFDKQSLPVSGDYNRRIRDAISKSDVLIFLINHHSVEKSYALTELKYFQECNKNPKNKVLPVKLDDVAFDKIPGYLKAVTILEPEGNAVAETVSEINHLRAQRRQPYFWSVAALGVGLLSLYIINYSLENYFASCPEPFAHQSNVNLDAITVTIPASSFKIGGGSSQDFNIPIVVNIENIEVDKYKVTNKQYNNFIERSRYVPKGSWKGFSENGDKDFHPATNLTWSDAKEYCQSQGKRLPKLEEWEYLCRTTEGYYYPWGNDFKKYMANVDGLCGGTTVVGSFDSYMANASLRVSGIFGNVREWTETLNRSKSSIIVKGSSFNKQNNPSINCLSKAFIPADKDIGTNDLGFDVLES